MIGQNAKGQLQTGLGQPVGPQGQPNSGQILPAEARAKARSPENFPG